jgi:hypothetical protein
MYNKKFLQEHFALTELQATDYLKAFNRLHHLLQEIDPLKRYRRYRFFHYEEEALEMLSELCYITNQTDAQALLAKFFYKFAKSCKQKTTEAARKILSISDNYIWPKEAYDDWKGCNDAAGMIFSPAAVIYFSN